ncbi:MAG TPA: type II secretion system protein [Tepidisphaeraceae bacterium]|nr:type II secretion system protein [Tepidisphaeraceae bacterium]
MAWRFSQPGGGRWRAAAPGRRAFSLLELLVVIGIIAMLIAMLLVALRRARTAAQSINCISNLHQIATGLRMFANDNGNRFPDPGALEVSWESTIRKYLQNSKVFECPGDEELCPTAGSSYDWRDTSVPETTLAGRSMTDVRRQDLVLAFEALPGWHFKKKMNVSRIDGSCCTMDDQEAVGDLLKPVQ